MSDIDAMTAAVQRAVPPGSDLWCETKARSILKTLDAGGYHLFTTDSLAAALHDRSMRCNHDRHYCADLDSPASGHLRDARKLIQAAKEAERE